MPKLDRTGVSAGDASDAILSVSAFFSILNAFKIYSVGDPPVWKTWSYIRDIKNWENSTFDLILKVYKSP